MVVSQRPVTTRLHSSASTWTGWVSVALSYMCLMLTEFYSHSLVSRDSMHVLRKNGIWGERGAWQLRVLAASSEKPNSCPRPHTMTHNSVITVPRYQTSSSGFCTCYTYVKTHKMPTLMTLYMK